MPLRHGRCREDWFAPRERPHVDSSRQAMLKHGFTGAKLEDAIVEGRNELAHALYEDFRLGYFRTGDESGRVRPGSLPGRLRAAWTLTEFPGRALSRARWLEMFREAGFGSDYMAKPPSEPLDVWRAQVGHIYGMAWSFSEAAARWFHDRNVRSPEFGSRAILLRGVVDPGGVLAIFVRGRVLMTRVGDGPLAPLGHHGGEDEVVIDPAYLRRPVPRIE